MNIRCIVTFVSVLSILFVSACTPEERAWQQDRWFARIFPSEIGSPTDNVTNAYFQNIWADNFNIILPNANLSSTANQTSGGTTVANNVTFNTNDQLVGITHSTTTNTSQIWIQEAGAYLITFSAIALASAPNKHLGIWLVKNEVNVPNSDTRVEFVASNNEKLITVTYIVQLEVSDYIQLKWLSYDDVAMKLQALNSLTSPARPNCPSVILTINKVSN